MSSQDCPSCDLLHGEDEEGVDKRESTRGPFDYIEMVSGIYARKKTQYKSNVYYHVYRGHQRRRPSPNPKPLGMAPLERLMRGLRITREEDLPKKAAEYLAGLFADKAKHVPGLRRQYEFNVLAEQWERETSHLSSPSRKAVHPAYQAIIRMGADVVPLILQRMKKRGGHWFWALSALTGENPIPKTSHGAISEMRDAWLAWGREREYC
jgi:hypothetical protein